MSNGDKILSENYLQHADHFTRVLNEKESFKKERFSENKLNSEDMLSASDEISKNEIVENSEKEVEVKKNNKPQVEIN